MEELIALRTAFNDQLIKSMMDAMLNSAFMASLSYSILYFCAGIGLFLTLSTMDMKKFIYFVFKLWIVLACVDPTRLGSNGFPVSGKEKLGIFMYHEFKSVFDKFAKNLDADDSAYVKNIEALLKIQNTVQEASVKCDMTTTPGKLCWVQHLNDTYVEPKNTDQAKSGLDKIINMLGEAYTFLTRAVTNMSMFIFPVLMFLLSLAQSFVTMFVLLGLGITTAFALMMATVLTPFALLPGKEGQIIGMYKMVLATTLFTFVSKFIMWISIIVTAAIGTATQKTLVTTIVGMIQSNGPTADTSQIQILLTANFACVFVILFFQIVAVTKIPKISRDIMNLGLTTLVNLGESLLGAAMGLAQMAGTSIAGPALGGMVGGAMGSMAGAIRSGGSEATPSSAGGSGSGFGSGVGAGGGGTTINNNSKIEMAGGSSPSIAEVALDQSNKASLLKRPEAVKEKSTFDNLKEGAKNQFSRDNVANLIEKGTKIGIGAGGVASGLFWDNMNAGLAKRGDGLGTIKQGIKQAGRAMDKADSFAMGSVAGGYVANKTMTMAQSAFKSKTALIDAPKDFAIEGGKLSQTMQLEKNAMDEESAKEFDSKVSKITQGTGTQNDIADVYRMQNTFDMTGKEEDLSNLNIDDNYAEYAKNQEFENDKILSEAKNESMNGSQMSPETLAIINNRIAAGLMAAETFKQSDPILKSVEAKDKFNRNFEDGSQYRNVQANEALDSSGKLKRGFEMSRDDSGNKIYSEKMAFGRDSQGNSILKNYNEAKSEYVANNKDDFTTFDQKLNDQNKDNTIKTIDELSAKDNLNASERQALFQTVKNNQNQLFGEKDRLQKIEGKFGGSVNLDHLKKSNAEVLEKLKSYSDNVASSTTEYNTPIKGFENIEMNFSDGSHGIIINDLKNPGQGVILSSKEDFNRLPNSPEKKALTEYFNDLDRSNHLSKEMATGDDIFNRSLKKQKNILKTFN